MGRVEAEFDDTVAVAAAAGVVLDTVVEDEMSTGFGRWTTDAD